MRPPQLVLLRPLGLGQRPRGVGFWRDELNDPAVGEDELERVDVVARKAENAREEACAAGGEQRRALIESEATTCVNDEPSGTSLVG